MQVKWRQYELIFIIGIALAVGVNELSARLYNSPAGDAPVVTHRIAANTILSFLLTYAVPVLLIVLINNWLLPRYLYTRNQLIVLPVAAIACWIIMAITFYISYYITFEYLVAKITKPRLQQEAGRQGLGVSTVVLVVYILYLCMREPIINWINRQGNNKPLYVMMANRITATAFIYAGLFIILDEYHLLQSDSAGIFYVFIVLPVIIIIFINVYGLFPYKHKKKLSNRAFLYKLSIAPLVLSLACWAILTIITGKLHIYLIPAQWLVLTIIATPLSYLFFIQQKHKLITVQQLHKTTADLAFLRSQINPHFLFNTLNTLYGTALQENASRTATGVQRLGDMMRFLLHDNHRDEIPLSRELEYLQNYIALQQLRIAQSGGIQIETSIHDCSQERMIAPMLLIPFVENAFKHGIRLTSPSYIRIHFHCDNKGIYLDVVNSLHSKRKEEAIPEHSGVGLQNVQQRLQLMYPGNHSLSIHQDDSAFEVHLFIKYQP